MPINHNVIRPLAALGLGLLVALYAYQRISDPLPALQRAQEEAVVASAREILHSYIAPGHDLEIVDPVAPNRKVGKVYIYPTARGWEVSGHYRRGETDRWHPYLMSLDGEARLESLAVGDSSDRLIGMSARDPKLSAVPQ